MIALPDAAIPYLLLQRTDYLVLPRKKFLYRVACRISRKPPIMVAVSLESRLRKRGIIRQFNADMLREYEGIREWLPPDAKGILDIGCGLGGIDVLLFEHYQRDPGLHLYLLDRTQKDEEIAYGYGGGTEFYNSLDLTREVLIGSGLQGAALTTIDARDDAVIDLPQPVDLVISLISWGFHYPVAVYLDEVGRLLKPGGRVILDVRRGTDGREQLQRQFGAIEVISEEAKKYRIVATRTMGV